MVRANGPKVLRTSLKGFDILEFWSLKLGEQPTKCFFPKPDKDLAFQNVGDEARGVIRLITFPYL